LRRCRYTPRRKRRRKRGTSQDIIIEPLALRNADKNSTNVISYAKHYKNSAYIDNTHKRALNSPFSGTTRVSRYLKGKTSLDFTEARDSEWQWHQLGHM